MTDNVENMVLDLLRAIRADIADLKREVTSNTLQISDMGQQVAGLTNAVYGGRSDLEDVKRRVERLERLLSCGKGDLAGWRVCYASITQWPPCRFIA